MCENCKVKPPVKYWLHIADDWTLEEKKEMLKYLLERFIYEDVHIYGLENLVKE